MRGRDYDGSYRTDPERRDETASRRDRLRAANRCVNGPLEDRPGKRGGIVHGPVISGGKCQRCLDAAHGRVRIPVSGGAADAIERSGMTADDIINAALDAEDRAS